MNARGATRALSQSELAKGLNLSKARVTALKKRGMPMDSVEAAQAWRLVHVAPTAHTIPAVPTSDHDDIQSTAWPGRHAEAVGAVTRLAVSVLSTGAKLDDALVHAIRTALRAVPKDRRERITKSLPVSVMDELTEHFFDLPPILADADNASEHSGSVPKDYFEHDGLVAPPRDATGAEAVDALAFWYRVAAGEVKSKGQ